MIGRLWKRYRLQALSDSTSLISLTTLPLAAAVLAVFGPFRRPLNLLLAAGLPLVGYKAAGKLRGWRARRSPIVRREDFAVVRGETATYDLRYRNPRWAQFDAQAVRLKPGYDPLLAVDGSPQLFKRLGIDESMTSASVRSEPVSLDVWLMPLATYHVDELGPIHLELKRRGIVSGFVFATEPSPALLDAVGTYAATSHLWHEQAERPPGVLLALNDWGAVEEPIEYLRRRGTRILAKVEGTQDFKNVETGNAFLPYSRADVALGQGAYDVEHCANDVEVVGSVRLERLGELSRSRSIERVTTGPLLNVNFSYGVGGAWSRPWYSLAARGVARAGLVHVSTIHPAVKAPFADHVTDWPIALCLETSSHFVSRRSASILDALQIGRPTIYFNPHFERVWDTVEWTDAVPQVRTPRALAKALRSLDHEDAAQVADRRAFLAATFVSALPGLSAAVRSADVVESWLSR